MNNYNFIDKLFFLLGDSKKKLILLVPLNILMAVIDLITITLLTLLVTTLSSKDKAIEYTYEYLPSIFNILDIDEGKLVSLISIFTVIFILGRTLLFIFINYVSLNVTFNFVAKLRSYLLNVYQNLPYDDFVNFNNSEIITKVNTMSASVVTNCIQPIIKIFSDLFLIIFVVIFLLIKYPIIFIIISLIIFLIFVLYDFFFKNKILDYGKNINKYSKDMVKNLTESLDGFRESNILLINNFFNYRLYSSAVSLAKTRIASQLITSSWRYILEFFTIFIFCILIFVFNDTSNNNDHLIATLALFIIITMRLLPSINQLMQSRNRIILGINSVNELYDDITKFRGRSKINYVSHINKIKNYIKKSNFDKNIIYNRIELRNINFSYVNSKTILNNINITINKNDFIGIYGLSGSGKSTLINILMGFLKPSNGQIILNKKKLLHRDIKKNRCLFSYIPQETFLIDSNVAENIALGQTFQFINQDKLLKSIQKSNLEQFINNLPNGLETLIGQSGKRISGGQRQRIALARAFYFNSKILIMDEPTSALDKENTDLIKKELNLLKGKVTIILISHEKSLINICNKIFHLKNKNLQKIK